jgi:hypothetical protein
MSRQYSFEEGCRIIRIMPQDIPAHGTKKDVRRAFNTIENHEGKAPPDIKSIASEILRRGSFAQEELEKLLPYMKKPQGKGRWKELRWDRLSSSVVLGPLFELVQQAPFQAMPEALDDSRRDKIDQRILRCASRVVTAKALYDKARMSGPDRKQSQEYVKARRDYLVAQGKLHTWTERSSNGRQATYYCVNPPSELEPAPAVAEAESIKPPVIVAEIVEPPVEVAAEVVEPPGAIDLYTKKQSRQSAMAGFGDSRPMEEVFSELNIKDLFWAQWQDTKWMTTNEVAAFLGLTPRAVYKNFERNRDEFIEAGEVQKLESQALKDFRDVNDSESLTSGRPSLHKFAPSINIYNMAGVLRMAWISEGEMGRAVRNATMQLIHSIPAMVKQAADNGRNRQLDTIPTGDLANGVVTEVIEQLMPTVKSTLKDAIKEAQPFFVQSIDGEFAGISPSMERCNQIIQEETPLPPMFTSGGMANWRTWGINDKPVNVPLPVLYVIFIDYELVGRLRECFSVGRGGAGSGRISASHERIRNLYRKQIPFKVLWTQVQRSTMKEPKELEKVEQKLQERLDTLWERQWSKEQQALLESEYPLFA